MDARIVGLPTLLAVYPQRLEVATVLDSLGKVSYPLRDVSVYYRLKGTDQVIDAASGQPAAGQSIGQVDLTPDALKTVETVVLLHPSAEYSRPVVEALNSLGEAAILYEGESDVEGREGGYERQDEAPTI